MSESGTEPFDQPRAFVTQFRLAVADGGPVFVSASDRAVIGTNEGCDFRLDDRTVSRFHCEISVRDGRAFVRDLGSKNGTRVDGVSVLEAHLHDGARLVVGHSTLHFTIGGEVAIPLSRTAQFGQLVGRSAQMRHVFALLERAAASKATLLLEGETGTGKEAAAESVHQAGARRDKPFVVVDCAALPPHLLESELFGHEKGAFTGAAARRPGAFETAQGGTVFLDEIGELSPDLQPKLLRVLERQEVKRIGADRYHKIDARIIAATHRNLRSDVNSKRFRSDLYYRLAVVLVTLPPLRERVEDLPVLVERLLASLEVAKRPEAARLRTPAFLAELAAHRWPGNVRELRNYLERSLALSGTAAPSTAAPASYKEAKERWERAYVEELLRAADGNVAAAAREARLDRAAFYRLLWRHGMR
ncbi:MAG TPA: sigma 54-interacting transcriptional regulator [Polyangia bacterium]